MTGRTLADAVTAASGANPASPASTEVPLGLPLGFFAAGLAGGLGLVAGSAALLPEVAHLRHQPQLLSLVHLFTLAWGSVITIGALHQLAPVILATRLYSVRVGWLSLATFVPGSFLIAVSFFDFWLPGVIGGAVLAVLGAALVAHNLWRTRAGSGERSLTERFILGSVAALLLTLSLGFTLAVVLRFGGGDATSLLGVHVFLGGVGWFTGIIIGVSYRLVPMFILSHGNGERLGHVVLGLLYAGVAFGVIAGLRSGDVAWHLAGALLVAAASVCYAVDVRRLWQRRVRPPDRWLRQVPWAVAYLLMATVGAAAALAWRAGGGDVPSRVVLALGVIFAFGWVGTMIVALLHKIVPFLVWYHRFSPKVGREPVPAMSALVDAQRGRVGFALYHACVLGLCVALVAGATTAARFAAWGLALAYVVLVSDLVELLVGRPVGRAGGRQRGAER